MRLLLLISLLVGTCTVLPAITTVDIYAAPKNGVTFSPAVGPTGYGSSGDLMTGWVYGEVDALTNFAGVPIWT